MKQFSLLCCGFFLLLISGCASPLKMPLLANGASAEKGIQYDVTIIGLDAYKELGLEGLLKRSLRLYTLKERRPGSEVRLRRRAESDRETVIQIVHSKGFYAAKSSFRVDMESAGHAKVVLDISPGPAYQLTNFDLNLTEPLSGISLPDTQLLDPGLGARADAARISAADARAIEWLHNHGYPDARKISRRVEVDDQAAHMAVSVDIDPGMQSFFGDVSFEGNQTVRTEYLQTIIPWSANTAIDRRLLDKFQRALSNTGLFSSVIVKLDGASAQTDPEPSSRLPVRVPVTVLVAEAPHQTVGGGVRYASDEGPGVRAFYEHRNLLSESERLRVNLDLLLNLQTLDTSLRKPQFLRADQDLLLGIVAQNEIDDAFNRAGIEFAAGLERSLSRNWRAGISGSADISQIDDGLTDTTSVLVGTPIFAAYDGTGNLLDPRQGSRLRFGLAPYVGQFDQEMTQFGVVDARASTYMALDAEKNYVVAIRGRLATIVGAELFEIPPQRRLFAGGGGSVRGYEKRFIGPLDIDNDPTGGRSLAEAGIELRANLSESFGLVPFLEAGSVSQEISPDFGEGVQVAAGLGLRYFTLVGPLRLDVGVPLNPRDVDNSYQVYFSIGQAF